MTENSVAPTRAYRVNVDFLSGDQCFASEQYDIDAEDVAEAVRLALIRAEDSIYHNPRVPNLGLRAHAGPVTDGEDPDPQSPCPAAAQRPVCPNCGREGIARDATASRVLSGGARVLPAARPAVLETSPDHLPAEISSVPVTDATTYRLAIALLPPNRRAIFELHQLGGLPYTEIAKRTGTSVADIEREIAAALTHLAIHLQDDL